MARDTTPPNDASTPPPDRTIAITDAVERLLADGGLAAVSMRAIAAEADVSLRLVQYYGRSKDGLLAMTLNRLATKSTERWTRRFEEGLSAATAADLVEGFLLEALPTDEASKQFHRLGVALETLAIGPPHIASSMYRAHLDRIADQLTTLITDSTSMDTAAAQLISMEIMGLSHGIGTLVMADQLTVAQARSLVENYLARLRPQLAP